MTRLDALRALYEAVKAESDDDVRAHTIRDTPFGGLQKRDFVRAYHHKSVDAALAFIAATLPGWRWIMRNTDQADVDRGECGADDAGFANVWEKGNPNEGASYWYAFAATPATALLLAALAAHIAQEEGK